MEHVTDLAVVAAGPAGLAAAIAAAERGVRVSVFEKAGVPGGAARMGMGPFGVESRLQKRNMIGLTKEEVFRRFMDETQWKVDANLVRNYLWRSGDTINWLEDMGVPFCGVARYFPEAELTWHQVKPAHQDTPSPGGGAVMAEVMMKRAQALGVTFFMRTPVKELIRSGPVVTGLVAGEGERFCRVRARAVVVATGGFGDDPDMIAQYCGFTYGKDLFSTRVPGLRGDGLRMVWAAGGGKSDMTMELILHSGMPKRTYHGSALFRQPSILAVNRAGERIINEEIIQNTAVSANAVKAQPGRTAYAILSSSIVRTYQTGGLDYPHFSAGPAAELDHFETEFPEARRRYPDCAFCAGSLEELAGQMKLDPAALERTVNEYNRACADHFDDQLCKSRRYLRPIEGETYYAERIALGAYGSLGGIPVNAQLQVLDTEHLPIPGLYGAGSDVCNLYAGTYLFSFPGNTMGFALNSGRLAGEHAAEEILASREELT